ncbi:CotH kinase family protein [Flectobacillus major]|jgi:hypothetical protein|uniref:CotH kinase family protein n=1 Tax=Flectobacillus major TaxID=103 RepID=UPI0005C713B2|nr:CotH kinase family protein [Flectobacillus major]
MKKILLITCAFVMMGHIIYAQTFQESNLPILKITTQYNRYIPDEPKILATLELINNGSNQVNKLQDSPKDYNGFIGIELRGSSSKDLFPKKPYGFETWIDTTQKSQKVSLLGMPEESDWVLNATYNDKTLMRDVLAYRLANQMGRYATKTRYCELVLNNSYQGVYILMEKIKRDKNRVDVTSLKKTDNSGDALTGGYILKFDKTSGSPSRFWTNTSIPQLLYQVEYPKYADLTNEQLNYIKQYITQFEQSLNDSGYQSPDAEWRKMIDLDAFVDYFILTEFTKNVDGYRLSTYFYKDRNSKDGRLKMGPAWDYNLAFGNADYYDGYKVMGWQYEVNNIAIPQGDIYPAPTWWSTMANDSIFMKKAAMRWKSLRKSILNNENISQWVDSTATVIQPAMKRNFELWTGVLGKKIWPNYYVGATYQDEVNWMKDWIRLRGFWLDDQFAKVGLVLGNEPTLESNKSLNIVPNPINDNAILTYHVLQKGHVQIGIYDLTGRQIANIIDQNQDKGSYHIPFGVAQSLPSGMYLLNFQLNDLPIERIKIIK